jgi:hypothetical protein
MIDEHSDVEVYVPLKVVNGKLKKDGSYLFFSKEMGNGDIVYFCKSYIRSCRQYHEIFNVL